MISSSADFTAVVLRLNVPEATSDTAAPVESDAPTSASRSARRTSTPRDSAASVPMLIKSSTRGSARMTTNAIDSGTSDATISAPTVVLIDTGTSAAAELFASALAGNHRADLIGEHTIGRAAQQKLIKLPDGSGLWLSTLRYLTPSGAPLHEKGLDPTVAVDEPDVTEFGAPPPTADPILDKAIERLSEKKAA